MKFYFLLPSFLSFLMIFFFKVFDRGTAFSQTLKQPVDHDADGCAGALDGNHWRYERDTRHWRVKNGRIDCVN